MVYSPFNRRDLLSLAGRGAILAGLPVGHALASATPEQLSGAGILNIRTFGATGDGTTLDSPAINRAIDAAAAAGGGTVYFPAGVYACYSLRLKTHVSLYLDAGATILAASTPLDGTTSCTVPP